VTAWLAMSWLDLFVTLANDSSIRQPTMANEGKFYALDAEFDASETLRQVVNKLLLDRIFCGMSHGGFCREAWARRASRPPRSIVVALCLLVGRLEPRGSGMRRRINTSSASGLIGLSSPARLLMSLYVAW
jgi:hypothetical protein